MQPKQVKIINDRLVKAVNDGIFNDLWFYIKDFNNYKLEMLFSYLDENDKDVSLVIGELNRYVYKNYYGKEVILKYDSPYLPKGIQNRSNNKYSIEDLYSKTNLEKIENYDSVKKENGFPIFIPPQPDSIYLRPEKKHFKDNLFSIELNKEFLFKVEESILNFCFKDNRFRNLLLELQSIINIDDSVGEIYFISTLNDKYGYIPPNNIFYFNEERFECKLQPLSINIIDEVNRIVGYREISDKIQKLPKSFLDDFIESEKMEKTNTKKRMIFKEYHRIIETIINDYFYKKHFNKIIQICNKLNMEGKRNPILNNIIKFKEDFNVTNLEGVDYIMYIFSRNSSDIYNDKIKEIIEKEIRPTVKAFESLSKFKNCVAHDNPFLNNQLYIFGINSLKTIILKLHQIFTVQI